MMDALKRVLHAMRLKAQLFYRSQLAAPWGMCLSVSNGAAFHLVEKGSCWLRMDGLNQPLHTGDLVVISNTAWYELVDHPDSDSIPLRDLIRRRNSYGIMSLGQNATEAQAILICGEFRAEQDISYPLFSLMPSLIYIPGNEGQAVEWLATSLRFIALEAADARPGSETVISRLMDILFIMVVRYWIDHHTEGSGGWLSALYHPQIGEILALIHRQPEHDWTVETLAASAHMSRSGLAAQFTAMVGEPPMKYLTRWRMQLAAMWLTDHPSFTIEEISQRVGYTSSYAFSKAFKRMIGVSPSEYRSQSRDTIRTKTENFVVATL